MDFRIADSLTVMNFAIRGITADFGPEHADTSDFNPLSKS